MGFRLLNWFISQRKMTSWNGLIPVLIVVILATGCIPPPEFPSSLSYDSSWEVLFNGIWEGSHQDSYDRVYVHRYRFFLDQLEYQQYRYASTIDFQRAQPEYIETWMGSIQALIREPTILYNRFVFQVSQQELQLRQISNEPLKQFPLTLSNGLNPRTNRRLPLKGESIRGILTWYNYGELCRIAITTPPEQIPPGLCSEIDTKSEDSERGCVFPADFTMHDPLFFFYKSNTP